MHLVVIPAAVFIGLVLCLEIGYRLGVKRLQSVPNAHEGFGAIEAAVFGIFGLLLSLTFFGAASRLDARRQLIVQEANAISSAYMRVDLLPVGEQPEVRRLFREYLDERVRISGSANEAAASGEMHKAASLQQAIWSHATDATKESVPGAALLIPAVNQMIEVASAKAIAVQTHVPDLVLQFLTGAALLSGLIAGFGMARGRRSWLPILTFASLISVTLYVMIDMEYPRSGLIRIGAADLAMSTLRDSIH